jgi:heme exporter protein CcmD
MHGWHEFITMGGYARFVWPAYAVALVVLVSAAWMSHRGLARALRRAGRGTPKQAAGRRAREAQEAQG